MIIPDDNLTFIQSLDISLAARLDKYSDGGKSRTPKVGLRLTPFAGIIFNATYGQSFRAPNLIERSVADNFAYMRPIPDPNSPSGQTTIIGLYGNSRDMKPEKGETWTTGVTIKPMLVPGLSVSATYFHTIFKNRISRIVAGDTVLELEELYSAFVQRNPSAEQLEEICNQSNFYGAISSCVPGMVGAIVDYRTQNMSRNTVRGIDASVDYGFKIGTHNVSIGASATYLIDYIFKQTESSSPIEFVDTIDNPVDFRGRSYVSVNSGGVNGTIGLNYTDSYKNNLSNLQRRVRPFITADANISVSFDRDLQTSAEGPFAVSVSVINLFNTDPPFADTFYGYGTSNADPLGRMLSVEMKMKW